MGAEDNGLTLEGLAQRLEALERENERMRSENAELRSKVDSPEGSGTRRVGSAETRSLVPRREGQRASGFEGVVSRRSLLTKAGAAAVAAVAAGTLLGTREAKANHATNASITPEYVVTHFLDAWNHNGREAVGGSTDSTVAAAVRGSNGLSGPGVSGRSEEGTGVEGTAKAITGVGVEGTATGSLGYGVRGTGFSGVWGEASHADGRGVMGVNPNGTGVKGQGNTGVLGVGFDDRQAGVKGQGPTGVWGVTSKNYYAGVYGQHTGTSGMGVLGIGTGSDAGVVGKSPTAQGVWAEGKIGVQGVSTGGGYGGRFEGGKAQLMIKPKGGTPGKPTTGAHAKGEISMDSAATLWVCTVGGTPGTWRKIATTAN